VDRDKYSPQKVENSEVAGKNSSDNTLSTGFQLFLAEIFDAYLLYAPTERFSSCKKGGFCKCGTTYREYGQNRRGDRPTPSLRNKSIQRWEMGERGSNVLEL
jgi:hypothetical protein